MTTLFLLAGHTTTLVSLNAQQFSPEPGPAFSVYDPPHVEMLIPRCALQGEIPTVLLPLQCRMFIAEQFHVDFPRLLRSDLPSAKTVVMTDFTDLLAS